MDANRGGGTHRGATLAERLNALFATTTYRSRGQPHEYTTPMVAQAISEDPAHDTTISRVYLNGLRNGANTNPTVAVLRAIAKFFDEHRGPGENPVTTADLLDEAGLDDRALRAAMTDERIRRIILRAGELDDDRKEQALRMITVLAHQSVAPAKRAGER